MQAAAEFVIKEMRQAYQPEACLVKPVQIGHIPLQGMPALGPDQPAHHPRPGGTIGQELGQIAPRPQDAQLIRRSLCRGGQACSLIQRAFGQVKPCARRAQLAHHQQGDVIACLGAVVFVIQARGAFGHRGKDLHRHIAFAQAGQIDMAPVGAPRQVTVPQQRIGMPIPDHQRVMHLLRGG